MKLVIVLLWSLMMMVATQSSNEPRLKAQSPVKADLPIDYEYVVGGCDATVGNCSCIKPLKWNQEKLYCQVNCADIDLTTGTQINRYQCQCIENAHWNLYYFKCYYDCALFNKKIFSPTYQMCVPDCSQIDFAYGPEYMTDKGVRCHCQTGYKWSWTWQTCSDYGSAYVEF